MRDQSPPRARVPSDRGGEAGIDANKGPSSPLLVRRPRCDGLGLTRLGAAPPRPGSGRWVGRGMSWAVTAHRAAVPDPGRGRQSVAPARCQWTAARGDPDDLPTFLATTGQMFGRVPSRSVKP